MEGMETMYSHGGPNLAQGLFLGIIGSIFYISLFLWLRNFALMTEWGRKFQDRYSLSVGNVLDMCNKLVSTAQAVLACCAGFMIIAACNTDILKDSHYMVTTYAWFAVSYFVYDIWSMYYVHCHTYGTTAAYSRDRVHRFMKERPVIILHHMLFTIVGMPITLMPSIRRGLGDCIIGLVFLMELSTPFVSLRLILSKLKMKSSRIYAINGILMIITFFFCRVMTFPFIYYKFSRQQGLSIFEVVKSLAIYCNLGSLLLILPQIYWFILMVKGAIKLLLPVRTSSGNTSYTKLD